MKIHVEMGIVQIGDGITKAIERPYVEPVDEVVHEVISIGHQLP